MAGIDPNIMIDDLQRGRRPLGGLGGVAEFQTDASGNVSLVGPDGAAFAVPRILAAYGVPIGRPPSGSVGANGALTLDVATNITYARGIYLHFPAGAVYSGSVAGFYWVVMSSTTAGTIYDNILGSAWPIEPVASPTPVVSGSIGAYVPSTSELFTPSTVLAGGAMGKNGSIRISSSWSQTSSAASKSHKIYLGSSTLESESVTDRKHIATQTWCINRGNETSQVGITNFGYNASWSAIGGSVSVTVIDTAIDNDIKFSMQVSNGTPANEFLICEAAVVEVLPFS